MRSTKAIFSEACAVFREGQAAFHRGDEVEHRRLKARHAQLIGEHKRRVAAVETARSWLNVAALAFSLLTLIIVLILR